jgi:hypothetical protein
MDEEDMEQEAILKNLEQWKLIVPLLYDVTLDGTSHEPDEQFAIENSQKIIDICDNSEMADTTRAVIIAPHKIIIFQLQYRVIDF